MPECKIHGGFYLKARAIQNSKIAHAPPHVREIWDWLIKEANHKDKKVGGIIIKRGQCLRSYKDIQEGLHWMVGWRKMKYSKAQCETAMKYLKQATMITTTKTTRGMIVTIINYDKYQQPENYETYKRTTHATTREPQTHDTINKNEKNKRINTLYSFYLEQVGPERKSKQRAIKNIKAYLKNNPFEDLKAAILNYAKTLNGCHPKYRKDPANFFGINEPYAVDFLPTNFKQSNPQPFEPDYGHEGDMSIYE